VRVSEANGFCVEVIFNHTSFFKPLSPLKIMEKTEIESYKKSGEITVQVIAYAKEIIKPSVKLLDVAEKIEGKIVELGGQIAFPVNLSIDEFAAHYTPGPDDESVARGLLKVDLGVAVDGYISDTAFSVDLTDDGKHKEMIELNKAALDAVLGVLKPGMKVNEIGGAVSGVVGDKYSIVRNLSGHSLDKDTIHAGLTLSNYENDNETELNDIAIAIEPFLTTGVGEIYEGKDSEIYMLQKDGAVRDSDGRKILKFVRENYKTRPFCRRWLVNAGFKKVSFVLKILTNQGILKNFPVLVEKSKKPVSQWEHSVLIADGEAVVYTRG